MIDSEEKPGRSMITGREHSGLFIISIFLLLSGERAL